MPNRVYGDLSIPPKGYVDNSDPKLLSDYLSGMASLNPEQLVAADVNGEGGITIHDVLVLDQWVKGTLPITHIAYARIGQPIGEVITASPSPTVSPAYQMWVEAVERANTAEKLQLMIPGLDAQLQGGVITTNEYNSIMDALKIKVAKLTPVVTMPPVAPSPSPGIPTPVVISPEPPKTGFSFSGLLPMGLSDGPPLPKMFNIRWPGKK